MYVSSCPRPALLNPLHERPAGKFRFVSCAATRRCRIARENSPYEIFAPSKLLSLLGNARMFYYSNRWSTISVLFCAFSPQTQFLVWHERSCVTLDIFPQAKHTKQWFTFVIIIVWSCVMADVVYVFTFNIKYGFNFCLLNSLCAKRVYIRLSLITLKDSEMVITHFHKLWNFILVILSRLRYGTKWQFWMI